MAFIWGIGFVGQKIITMPPIAFNTARCVVTVLFLMLLVVIRNKGKGRIFSLTSQEETRKLWKGGVFCGIAVTFSMAFQQLGLSGGASAAKGGFLTAMYIVMIPILLVFAKRKVKWHSILAVAVAVTGFYFLSLAGHEISEISINDLFLLLSAFGYSVQIILVDHFSKECENIRLSLLQFLVAAVLSFFISLVMEKQPYALVYENLFPLVLLGIVSGGLGYTLQIVSQKHADPTMAAVLFSMEAVFALINGAIFLHE